MSAPTPAAPKRTNGCLIAFLVVCGVFVLFLAVGAFFFWRFAKSEKGQRFIGLAGDAISIASAGSNAPGTAELRDLGCDKAVVIRPEDMQRLMSRFDERAGSERVKEAIDRPMVMCQLGVLDHALACDEVARTYRNALGEQAGKVLVTVKRQGKRGHLCMQAYDANGAAESKDLTFPVERPDGVPGGAP